MRCGDDELKACVSIVNERFIMEHKCQRAKIMILDGRVSTKTVTEEDGLDFLPASEPLEVTDQPKKISLHA